MFNPNVFENSRPDGHSVLELVDREHGPQFVPLKRTELEGEVTGPLAALRLRQVFAFERCVCDHTIEAAYRFPLPGDAAVTSVRVRFGDTEIVARLSERASAEQEYRQACSSGRQAALVTRESADVFTLQITGIEPGRVPRRNGGPLNFRLLSGGRELSIQCVETGGEGVNTPTVKALVGARLVTSLESLAQSHQRGQEVDRALDRMGYDSRRLCDGSDSVYVENSSMDRDGALKRLIVDESLNFGLSSSETAWVAVRSEKGNPVTERVIVANALSQGWAVEFESDPVSYDEMPPFEVRNCRPAARQARVALSRNAIDMNLLYKGLDLPCEIAPSAMQIACFEGVPVFQGEEAVLYDSAQNHDILPSALTLLEVRILEDDGALGALRRLSVLVFVDDMALPRAKVKMEVLLMQGGRRPLNIALGRSAHVRLVLIDEQGVRSLRGPKIAIALK